MVVGYRADSVETAQVVFERVVISMPGHNVEWGLSEFCRKEIIVEFADHRKFFGLAFVIVESCNRGLKVAGIGESIRSDRTQFGKFEMTLIYLAYISSYWTRGEFDPIPLN